MNYIFCQQQYKTRNQLKEEKWKIYKQVKIKQHVTE